jgi:hypothetical protein
MSRQRVELPVAMRRAGGDAGAFQDVECGICHTQHTRPDRVRLQPTATSFVASIRGPV